MWDFWLLQPFRTFGIVKGNRDDTMVFRLEPKGNYFMIKSMKFPTFSLGKRGIKDDDVWMTNGP